MGKTARRIGVLLQALNWKTIAFNFRYLPFLKALRLPILVSRNVILRRLAGSVDIIGEVRTGLVQIGFGDVGIFDRSRSKTIWHVEGKVVFEGKADIGHGSRINVGIGATLRIGGDFILTAESSIVAQKEITIGRGCLLSWDILLMDDDLHPIRDDSLNLVNPPAPIKVGDRVWIGCRVTVLKGSVIADGVVVGAGSLVANELDSENCVYAGVPARKVKTGIHWEV